VRSLSVARITAMPDGNVASGDSRQRRTTLMVIVKLVTGVVVEFR
jgi:hypothetical protein